MEFSGRCTPGKAALSARSFSAARTMEVGIWLRHRSDLTWYISRSRSQSAQNCITETKPSGPFDVLQTCVIGAHCEDMGEKARSR